jgi:hypothetical protein
VLCARFTAKRRSYFTGSARPRNAVGDAGKALPRSADHVAIAASRRDPAMKAAGVV